MLLAIHRATPNFARAGHGRTTPSSEDDVVIKKWYLIEIKFCSEGEAQSSFSDLGAEGCVCQPAATAGRPLQSGLAQQLRQLGHIGGNPSRLIFAVLPPSRDRVRTHNRCSSAPDRWRYAR